MAAVNSVAQYRSFLGKVESAWLVGRLAYGMSDDDRSTRVQGSRGRDFAEVRLSPQDSRSNVGKKGSSRIFE